MELYKLTDSQGYTHNKNCKWGKGITNTVAENNRGKKLCSNQVIHAYTNPNLALLLNPIHANYHNARLYEAEGEIKVQDWGKVGVWELTTVKRFKLPGWYKNKSIRKKVQVQFSVLCAKAVLKSYEEKFPNDNRPRKAIKAAEQYLSSNNRNAACAARATDKLNFAKMADKSIEFIGKHKDSITKTRDGS